MCEVCGKHEAITTMKSRLWINKFKICKSCLQKRLEPYETIINFLTSCFVLGSPPNDVQKRKINYILNELHTKYNQFESDVHREVDAINQALLYVEKHPEEFREERKKFDYANYHIAG